MRSMIGFGLAAVFLSGCATIDNRYGAGRLDAGVVDDHSAIVILSAGAAERCVSAGTFLKLKPADVDYEGSRGDIALLPVDGYVMKSDFADHQGNLHVVKLQPGSYYLAPWIANGFLAAKRVPKAEFSVQAGEIVYLGEYFMTVSCQWSDEAVFRDEEKRDMSLLSQQNPALAAKPIVKHIARFTGWAVGG